MYMGELLIAKKCSVCDKLYNGNKDSALCPSCKECLLGVVNIVSEIKKLKDNPQMLGDLSSMLKMPDIPGLTPDETQND